MFLLILLQWVFWVLLLAFGITQVILPLIQKRPLFPLFRARRVELETEIVELNEQIREEVLDDEAQALRDRLEALRKAPEASDKSKSAGLS